MKLSDWLRGLVGIEIIEEDVDDEVYEDIDALESFSKASEPQMLKTVSPEERVIRNYKTEIECCKGVIVKPEKMTIEMFCPHNIYDCPKMADLLRKGYSVVINIDGTKTDDAMHIYFFMRGCVYALGGSYRRISDNVFMFLPSDVEVAGIGKDISFQNTFTFEW